MTGTHYEAGDEADFDGLDALADALNLKPKPSNKPAITKHPDWPTFMERTIPARLNFYYTNKDGDESYFEQMPVIKLDLTHLHFILEGHHGDPLKFEVAQMQHTKDARTGEPVQDLLYDLHRMWRESQG